MERFIIIDGNSLMYRAYFALPGMTTKLGEPTGAVFGFMSMLIKLLNYEPTHMAVAFDVKEKTFRHLKYEGYKAGRAQTPPELIAQFSTIKHILSDMKIAVLESPGFEADDILGTLSHAATKQGVDSLLVTGDRDALQLISEHTHVLMTKKGISETIEYDEKMLFEAYGLEPQRMIDLKALMGDNSDNIPGIKGIGEKTALKLLQKYGTLDSVLTNGINEEKGALLQKLTTYADDARLSYELGTINTEAKVDTELEKYKFSKETMELAVPTLSALQLRSIIERLPKSENATPVKQREKRNVETKEITTLDEVKELVNDLLTKEYVSIHAAETFTIAADSGLQYKIKSGGTLLDMGLDIYEVYNCLRPVFESKAVGKIVFDGKKLMHTLSDMDIGFENLVFDAMIADYLLNAVHPSNTLDELSIQRELNDADACCLFILYDEMTRELDEKNLLKLYTQVELPLVEVLYDMEKTGFCVDKDVLYEAGEQFSAIKEKLENEIYAMAGCEFNIQSPKQLSDVLFNKLMLPPPKQKTKQGFSTSAEVLENYESDFPIVKAVLEYRFAAKLKSTFIDALILQINRKTGRVHTTFNQNVTATGRISSTEPNLQNIPTRQEAGREIRKAFVASSGNCLVDADYSQIELRVLAHMSGDETMIQAFCEGTDIHTKTACEVFGTNDVTSQMRSAAKAVNFGIVYGISEFGLAKQLGVSRKRAGEYLHMYLERYKGVDSFMKKCISDANENGCATTLLGRRRELFELKSSNYNTRSFGERIAMNMPVQGTAADIIKIAMVNVYNELKRRKLKAKLVLQIHDELIVDTPECEKQEVQQLLKECMENAYKLNVPLVADVNTGKSWFEAK